MIARILSLVLLASTLPIFSPPSAAAEAPRTLRLDYFHTGGMGTEVFSVDALRREPMPWPGHPRQAIDSSNRGKYRFEIRRSAGGKVLYSRGFASIYGEWETTAEAQSSHRTFHESLRFPDPGEPFSVLLSVRDAANDWRLLWQLELDPSADFVDQAAPPCQELITLESHGPPADKVDLLLLGDGYTAEECPEFIGQAKRLVDALFSEPPFATRREDFNVWAICPPAAQSGVSRPSTGLHRRSPLGATYDAFGSERYVLSFENRRWRDVAAWAPYEFVEILVNSETYGGGGIFGLYSTAAARSSEAEYLFVHEFAHHFAGLADEYYTSPVAYQPTAIELEPWEPNVTALRGEGLKWQVLASPGVELPTPWPKVVYEAHARKIQQRRQQIRAANRPESEMAALFAEQRQYETKLFEQAPNWGQVGAFEGANYSATGYYRSEMDCVMFSRNPVGFCAACRHGLEQIIDLYTPSSTP